MCLHKNSKSFCFVCFVCFVIHIFTGAHCDYVYMGRGTGELITVWIPFDDIKIEKGTLAILDGSSYLSSFQKLRNTYGKFDVEKERLHGSGWLTEDPLELTAKFGGKWRTTDFKAGDILMFGLWTIHCSTTNQTNQLRISCDTRWYRYVCLNS